MLNIINNSYNYCTNLIPDIGSWWEAISMVLNATSMPNWVAGILAILGGIFSTYLFNKLKAIQSFYENLKTSIDTEYSCVGIYNCEYQMPWKPEGEKILLEKISIVRQKTLINDQYIGYLIQRQVGNEFVTYPKNTIRLDCQLFHKKYLIGRWRDPDKDTLKTGSFTLEIDDDGKNHLGDWSGWSNTNKRISSGRWSWEKSKEASSLNLFKKSFAKIIPLKK